ncbi:MAG: class I SAM-dependent methyltransferase [Rickettsiales bacterium]|jgi:SAM-dependent methyltransferase|nr:class I SAM-dependent methyltransferase [Rickettsiales bacterium]
MVSDWIKKEKITVENLSILDVGGADGERIKSIFGEKNFKEIVVLDNCKDMFLGNKQNENVKFVEGDICTFDAFGDRFNIATCLWNVFGHIDTHKMRAQAVDNIYRMLKPSGLLFIDFNNRENVKNYRLRAIKNILLSFLHIRNSGDFRFLKTIGEEEIPFKTHLFTKNEVLRIFRNSGFSLQNMMYLNYKSGNVENNHFSGSIFCVLKK